MGGVPFLSLKSMNDEIRKEALSAFEIFFDQQQYILGPQVEVFEQSYAKFNEVKDCIGVANGLDALRISFLALGIERGDEVIIPSHTFIATALAVSQVGASPIFVEPDSKTMNVDPSLIEKAITSKTKAIVPVHLYGQACQMKPIVSLADQYQLSIVEDNAQAQGATYLGQKTGSFGQINATSFYPGKNLGAFGDAGAITTNSEDLARKARLLRNYGSEKKYYEVEGLNSRLDELQAVLLGLKLKHLEKWNLRRISIADRYSEGLEKVGDLILPLCGEGSSHVYHLYVVRTCKRDKLQEFLKKNGVGTLIHYPLPIHMQTAYHHLGFNQGSFPIAESIASSCLSLPLYPGMSDIEVDRVIETIQEFYA
jgi:dTDP-4-amino-4,6-dideoxygalactose transaminase